MAVKVISEDKSSQNCLQNIINVIKSELFNTGVVCIHVCTMYIVHVFGIIITIIVCRGSITVTYQWEISVWSPGAALDTGTLKYEIRTVQYASQTRNESALHVGAVTVQKGESSGKAVAALR